MPTVEERLVATGEDAVRAADSLGYPVALKLCAAGIPHKSEHGLVKLGLGDAAAVRAAAAELNAVHRRLLAEAPRPEAPTAKTVAAAPAARGLLVQPMVRPGIEMVIGSRRDPTFGPIVMVGLGGLFVEHFADVAFGLAPVTREQARAMLRSLRAWPLLTGARGRPLADVDAIADALIALSRLALAGQAFIREIDVNPLIALASGVVAVDGLVVVDAAATTPGSGRVPLPPYGGWSLVRASPTPSLDGADYPRERDRPVRGGHGRRSPPRRPPPRRRAPQRGDAARDGWSVSRRRREHGPRIAVSEPCRSARGLPEQAPEGGCDKLAH